MVAASAASKMPQLPSPHEEEQRIVLRGVSWAKYLALRELTDDIPGLRLTYLKGALELMTPGPDHERFKSLAARLLELWAIECDAPLYAYGSTTFRAELEERGLEPDECYFIGADMDEESRPFPDIAIEVALSRSGIDKLEAYRGLGVREVWFYTLAGFSIHALHGDVYVKVERSELLPMLDIELMARFVQRRDQPVALREYRETIRGH